MIWAVIWYWLLGIFTITDIITTRIALDTGYREANPFMAPVLDHLIAIKFGFLLAMIILIILTEKLHKGSGWLVAAGGSCVTFAAVLSNFITILRQQPF